MKCSTVHRAFIVLADAKPRKENIFIYILFIILADLDKENVYTQVRHDQKG